MNLRQNASFLAIATLALLLNGCGGSSNTPPPTTVSLSGQPPSLTTGATASISATTSSGVGVNWTATCAASPCGTFSPASTASGAPTTYTAPSTPTSVTVTATTSSGSTASASATITVAAPPISVAFNPAAPLSLNTSATTPLTAVVTNDTKGVNWTVTCGSSSCGSFSSSSTASGTATTYTAPASVPTGNTVTITATSITDTTKFASATITITAPVLSVNFNPAPPTNIRVGATSSLTAVVSNDSQNKGVTWSVTCGSSSCGSFSSASTPSGAATVYTAPATAPSPNTVTIKATSVTDTTKFATATINIGSILADGNYVYHVSGYDSTGPYFLTGAFTVAGGLITAGEQDFSDAGNPYNNPLVPANCSLSVTGNTIQVVLATANTLIGVNGAVTLRGQVVSSSRVLISEFDAFAVATGSIDLQTSTAAPSGGYAFLVSGWDLGTQINQLAIGGILNISGTSLTVGSSVFDYNVGGTVGLAQTFASGSVTAPDSFGRVSFTLTPSTASGVPGFIFTGYVVNSSQIQLIESQVDPLGDDLGGMALSQGSKTGHFSQASIANTTYAYGVSDASDLLNLAGTFSFSSSGAATGTMALNNFSFFGSYAASGGQYVVDPSGTGRVSISNVSISILSAGSTFAFELYLDGNGNALQLGADDLQITSGPAYQQVATSPDYEGSYAIAGQGYQNGGSGIWGAVGPVAISSDTLAGSTDYNANGSTLTAAQPLSGTETSSNGSMSIIGLDSTNVTASRGYTYFPIDNKRFVAIETDGVQVGLVSFEGTTP